VAAALTTASAPLATLPFRIPLPGGVIHEKEFLNRMAKTV
jgi:hypothetical protein